MSTAVLNVWISNLGDPCSVANDIGAGIPYAWSVAVIQCDGRVLNWSEGRFRLHHDDPWIRIPRHTPPGGKEGWWYEMIPTRDGHVEIEVPPGCYAVVGSMHTWFVHGVLYGNWATDRALVQATCGTDVCVKLYASSIQPCSVILGHAIRLAMQNKAIDRKQGDAVLTALATLGEKAEASAFDRGYLEVMERAVAQIGKPSPLEPRKEK